MTLGPAQVQHTRSGGIVVPQRSTAPGATAVPKAAPGPTVGGTHAVRTAPEAP